MLFEYWVSACVLNTSKLTSLVQVSAPCYQQSYTGSLCYRTSVSIPDPWQYPPFLVDSSFPKPSHTNWFGRTPGKARKPNYLGSSIRAHNLNWLKRTHTGSVAKAYTVFNRCRQCDNFSVCQFNRPSVSLKARPIARRLSLLFNTVGRNQLSLWWVTTDTLGVSPACATQMSIFGVHCSQHDALCY